MAATKGSAKPPVSTHPLFPAIVALWFAALLGLGSLILPTVLLERLVTVTGVSSLLPMAAPPLGFTAKATLAIGAAAIGAILGMALARRVADSHAPRPRARFVGVEGSTLRPISAHDELGGEGLGASSFGADAAPAVTQKRRSLALREENRRSAFLQHVPLPGEGYHAPPPADEPDDALELGEFAADEELRDVSDQDDTMTDGTNFRQPQVAAEFTDEPQDFAVPEQVAEEVEEEEEAEAEPADALRFAPPSLRRKQDVPAFIAAYDFDDEEDSEDEVMGEFDPLPAQKSFVSAQRQFDRAAPAQQQFAVVEPEPDIAAAIAAGVDARPLDDLGLVQLAARLGASIERRRAMRATLLNGQGTRPAPVFAASPEDFDAAAAEDAARARASFFAPQQAVPEAAPDAADMPVMPRAYEPAPEVMEEFDRFEPFDGFEAPADFEQYEDDRPLLARKPSPLRELSFDEDDEDEESALSSSLAIPRRTLHRQVDPVLDDESDAGEDEGDQSEFSSLLTMTNPFQKKNEFVRIEEPEPDEDETEAAVTFPTVRNPANEVARPFDPPSLRQPAANPADPGDAERELRAALATLQRMSGAA